MARRDKRYFAGVFLLSPGFGLIASGEMLLGICMAVSGALMMWESYDA